MGQKVNPIGLRLGINRTWDSRWFARKDYAHLLHEDLKLKGFLGERLLQAGVSRIVIERAAKKTRITIHSARPGVVIGKKGADIEKLRVDIAKMTNSEVSLNIVEIRKRGAVGHAPGRARHPHQLLRPPGRRRDRAHGMVSRRPRAAAHAAR